MRQSWRTLGAIILGAMALVATGRAVAQADTTAPRVTDACVDTTGNEPASLVDRAVTINLPATVPEAPENLHATRYGNRTMTLRWGVPWSGGSPILKYQVRHAPGRTPAGEWTNVAGGGNARSHVFRNLASSSSYTFQVRAVNAVGAGEEESITKTTLSAPTRVRYLRATAGNARVILRWVPPLNVGGEGAFVLRYEYQQRAGSESWSEWRYAADAWQRGQVVTGLANGTSYSFRMRAVNQDLAGPESIPESSTPAPQFRLSVHPGHFVAGGESTTATISITDGYVLETDTTFYLRWFGTRVNEGTYLDSRNPATITLPAGQISASVELKGKADADSGPQVSYFRPITRDLIATQGGIEIDRTPLTVHDNEKPPVVSLGGPGEVDEGGAITLTWSKSVRTDYGITTTFEVTDPWRRTFTGLPSTATQSMDSTDMTVTRGIRLPDDNVKNGNTWITFTIGRREGDDSYHLGPNTVKVRVIDDETP